jgi:hypothetical protein
MRSDNHAFGLSVSADPATQRSPGDLVSPQWRSGELITAPAAAGRLVPFESRTPMPCCTCH